MDPGFGGDLGARVRACLLLGAAAALGCAAPAAADHPGVGSGSAVPTEITTTEQTPSGPVEVSRHLDPLPGFTGDGRSAVAATPSAGDDASARSIAQSCTPVQSTTDNTANATHSATSRVLKVIYAYPTDVGNRLGTYGPVIQTGIRYVSELAAGESGDRKSLRFDLGTSAGAGCVDIQSVALALPSSAYTAVPSQTFTLLRTELLPRVAGQLGSRNFVVYADGIAVPGVGGEAQIRGDDSVAGTAHGLGGLWAMVYGRGGTDFIGSGTAFAPGTTSRSHVDLALHEISHTLGGVQSTAPHRSTAYHCLDEFDLLCYDDDGAGGLATYVGCNSPTNQQWDCNKDDYFSPTPAAGSYLATHWNLYNSVFMCPVAQCAPGGVSGPPTFPQAASPAPTSSSSGPPKAAAPAKPKKKKKKKRKRMRRQRR